MHFFSLEKLSWAMCGALLVTTISLSPLESSSLPIPVGPAIRVSPTPGPANPDPILQNLQAVMDDHYQPPYYPGVFNSPTYLSDIYYVTDNYITNGLIFNPCNDDIMHLNIGQNLIENTTEVFRYDTIGTNTFATSLNGGQTWNYGPPVEQIIPLGGTKSQIINSSIGPGLSTRYSKNGRLDASGWGFFDMRANPPNSVPMAGFLFTSSYNSGQSWDPLQTVLSTTQDFWFSGPPYFNPGIYPREFYVIPNASDPDILYASSTFALAPSTLYSSTYFSHSEDAGKNFAPFREVYKLIDDPVWKATYFDPAFPGPNYLLYGGLSINSARPLQVDDNVLLLPIRRRFPNPGNLVYNQYTALNDQAVVRSLDNGKTWEKVAGHTPTYRTAVGEYDPGFANPNTGRILEGQQVFGFFFDGGGQTSNATVSPTTGRIYLCYEAANPVAFAVNPTYAAKYLLMNSSADKGATFSQSVQANRTPTDIPIGAQQCFSSRLVATKTGQIAIAYYDFRNWTGTAGEDLATTPLPLDAWLAIYDETEDPNGGSTGIGLDFVGEIRLTPQSSNARIPAITPPPGYLYLISYITGTPEGIILNVNERNELYVGFSMIQPAFRSKVLLNQYKGMVIDMNSYQAIMLQKFKFPNPNTN